MQTILFRRLRGPFFSPLHTQTSPHSHNITTTMRSTASPEPNATPETGEVRRSLDELWRDLEVLDARSTRRLNEVRRSLDDIEATLGNVAEMLSDVRVRLRRLDEQRESTVSF